MPIYETGPGSFMVSVGSGKSRYREVFPTRAKAEVAEAEEILRRKRAKEAPGAPTTAPKEEAKGKTLRDAYNLATRLRWKELDSSKTQDINAKQVMKVLGGDTLLKDITAEEITEMILEFEDGGNSGSTVNRKLSCLSTMLKVAKDHKWLSELPKITRRKEGRHRIRWIDVPEEGRMLAMCDTLGLDALKDYIIVAIDTGFRRGELLGFEPRDYSNGLLHLHPGETKNDEARSVPATKRVHEILMRRSNYARVFVDLTIPSLRYQWDILKGHLGLEDDKQFVVHTLRHTCASRMVQREVPLATVQAWMGHKHIATTLRYAHLSPNSLLRAKQALEEEPKIIPAPALQAEVAELHDF